MMAGEYCVEKSIRIYQTTRRLPQNNVTVKCPLRSFPSRSEVKTRRTQTLDTTLNSVYALILCHNFVPGRDRF